MYVCMYLLIELNGNLESRKLIVISMELFTLRKLIHI